MGVFHNFQRYPQIRVNAPNHWEENGSLFDDRTRLAATTKDASEFERRPDSDGVKFQGEAAHMPAVAPQDAPWTYRYPVSHIDRILSAPQPA